MLDVLGRQWAKAQVGLSRPAPRGGHSCVALRGDGGNERWATIGGSKGGYSKLCAPSLEAFNLGEEDSSRTRGAKAQRGKSDVEGKPMPPTVFHSATVLGNGEVVVFGGRDGKACNRKVFVLRKAKQWEWFEPFVVGDPKPSPRMQHAACLLADGKTLLVHGGCDVTGDERRVFGDAFLLDTELWEWAAAPKPIQTALGQRHGHSLTPLTARDGSYVACFGGKDNADAKLQGLVLLPPNLLPKRSSEGEEEDFQLAQLTDSICY